jgi:hypothetical protein
MYQRDMSGWKNLVNAYYANTAPTVAALTTHGFKVKVIRSRSTGCS